MVKSLLATLFGVELSRGSINRLRNQVSEAIAVSVEQAHQYVQAQAFVHSDETGFSQGNGDGPDGVTTQLKVRQNALGSQNRLGKRYCDEKVGYSGGGIGCGMAP